MINNNSKYLRAFSHIFLIVSILTIPNALAFERLTDEQLNKVVAGTEIKDHTNEISRIPIMMSKSNGNFIEGEIILQRFSNQTSGTLSLQDGAQNNLRSLINVNAVNSPVNVLLNLNININSQVGVLEQLNIQGRL